jgi:hypothetical protein
MSSLKIVCMIYESNNGTISSPLLNASINHVLIKNEFSIVLYISIKVSSRT